MRVDIDEPRVNVGDPLRVFRGLRLDHQRGPLGVGGQHEVDQRAGTARCLLLDAPHLHLLGNRHPTEIGLQLVGDHLEERGLAGPVTADEADPRALRQCGGRLVEENPRPEPQCDVIDMEHLGLVARVLRERKGAMRNAAMRVRLVRA